MNEDVFVSGTRFDDDKDHPKPTTYSSKKLIVCGSGKGKSTLSTTNINPLTFDSTVHTPMTFVDKWQNGDIQVTTNSDDIITSDPVISKHRAGYHYPSNIKKKNKKRRLMAKKSKKANRK